MKTKRQAIVEVEAILEETINRNMGPMLPRPGESVVVVDTLEVIEEGAKAIVDRFWKDSKQKVGRK